MAEKILMKEFKLLQKEKWAQVSVSITISTSMSRLAPCYPRSHTTRPPLLTDTATRPTRGGQLFEDDISRWNIALMVLNPDSMYYGGYFKSMMTFPRNYPYSPP
ncbi:hypothetical protein KEM52_003308, partial [Ascosphaera acerosa]